MGGDGKGSSSETSVVDTTPSWIKDIGTTSGSGFLQGLKDYKNIKNPYKDFKSLFSDETGKSYLDAFTLASKEAYNKALADTKDLFSAKGLYGSAGNKFMSGAMASAGENYANAMANAQIQAQKAQANDYNMSAVKGLWDQQKAQQVLNNYLSGLQLTIPAVMGSQQIVTEEDSGKGTGLMSGLGQIGGVGASMYGDMFSF